MVEKLKDGATEWSALARRARLACVGLASTLLACGGAGAGVSNADGPWRATIDTVGDTVVIRTEGGSVWGDTTELVPELTIGEFEGPDEYLFGQVRSIAVSGAGEIFVLDAQAPIVRAYAPDGSYLRAIGRDGGGPGEYKRPESLAILPDGRLLVRDPGNARINVYDPTGEPLTSWRLPSGGGFSTSRRMYVDTAGNSYTPILLAAGVDVTEWSFGLARFTSTGEHRDTLPAPTWDFEAREVTARREGSSSTTTVPFSPTDEWTFSPFGYFVGGVSTGYRVDLYRAEGPVLRIERAFEPVPVHTDEKAEREHQIVENFKRNYGSWKWNGPPVPDTKPPYRGIAVDDDGRIWVRVAQRGYAYRSAAEAAGEEERTGRPQLRYREPVAFDVFDDTGRFLGHLRAPDALQGSPEPIVRGDTLWGVTRDELDVGRVVRFRLVRGSR